MIDHRIFHQLKVNRVAANVAERKLTVAQKASKSSSEGLGRQFMLLLRLQRQSLQVYVKMKYVEPIHLQPAASMCPMSQEDSEYMLSSWANRKLHSI